MLRDYEPKDWTTDQFTLNTNANGNPRLAARPMLAFPCCLCKHGDKEQAEDPCCRCGHNVNSSAAKRATPIKPKVAQQPPARQKFLYDGEVVEIVGPGIAGMPEVQKEDGSTFYAHRPQLIPIGLPAVKPKVPRLKDPRA